MTDEEYKKTWKEIGSIEIKMVEKQGKCKHQLGDVFQYKTWNFLGDEKGGWAQVLRTKVR